MCEVLVPSHFSLLHKSHDSRHVKQLGNSNALPSRRINGEEHSLMYFFPPPFHCLLTAATAGTVGAAVPHSCAVDQPMFLETVANISSHMPPVFLVEV